jgi:hypothetical protein
VPGYGFRAPGQEHRDAPLSARGQIIWWTVVGLLVLGFIALVVLTR